MSAAAAPRPIAGRTLLRRLLSNCLLLDSYEDPRVLPVGMRPVLEAACDLIASSDEPGVFRLRPGIDADATMPARLARRAHAIGSDDDMARGLEFLVRLGFLRAGEDCILLPANFRAARSASASNGGLGGRPRAGETTEQYRARKAAEAERARMQGKFMLPQAGGGASSYGTAANAEALATHLRASIAVVGADPLPKTEPRTEPGTEPRTEPGNLTGNLESQVLGSAGLAKEERESLGNPIESKEEKTVSLSLSPSARAGENPAGNLTGNLDPTENLNLTGNLDETADAKPAGNLDGSDRGGAEAQARPPEARPAAEFDAAARRLQAAAADKWRWSKENRKAAFLLMRSYLVSGYSEAEVRAAIDQNNRCESAAYYRSVLDTRRQRQAGEFAGHSRSEPAPGAEAPAPATPGAPYVTAWDKDPRIADHAPWRDIKSADTRSHLKMMLDAVDLEDPARRAEKLRYLKGRYTQEWDLFEARYENARDLAYWDTGARRASTG